MADGPQTRVRRVMQMLDRSPDHAVIVRSNGVTVRNERTNEETVLWPGDPEWPDNERSLMGALENILDQEGSN